MKTREFINQLQKETLVEAIRQAEAGNSGDIVLFIDHRPVEDALPAAQRLFKKLKLDRTTPRNSLLIFLAPESQQLAVIGGTDLHRQRPAAWWTGLVSTISAGFKAGELTSGLLEALQEIGRVQRKYFPSTGTEKRTGQHDLLEER